MFGYISSPNVYRLSFADVIPPGGGAVVTVPPRLNCADKSVREAGGGGTSWGPVVSGGLSMTRPSDLLYD